MATPRLPQPREGLGRRPQPRPAYSTVLTERWAQYLRESACWVEKRLGQPEFGQLLPLELLRQLPILAHAWQPPPRSATADSSPLPSSRGWQ
eukprot:6201683-Pleurochrysis_carterae.AAC.1